MRGLDAAIVESRADDRFSSLRFPLWRTTVTPEKEVDTAVVTNLLSLALEGSYGVAILVSSDVDHVPAVEWIQSHGRKVINATWSYHGLDLAKTYWASLDLDSVIPSMKR